MDTIDPPMLVNYGTRYDMVDINEAPKVESQKLVTSDGSSKKSMGVDKNYEKDKQKGKEV